MSMDDDEELEDWDAEFGFDDDDADIENLFPSGSRIIKGIKADRADPAEDWGEDFMFSEDDKQAPLFSTKPPKKDSKSKLETEKKEEKLDDDAGDDVDFSDFSENWDEEMGFETEQEDESSSFAKQLFNDLDEQPPPGGLPDNHRFFQEKATTIIITYPKATLLYSLREKEGHRLFNQETEFVLWLSELITKYTAVCKPKKAKNSNKLAPISNDRSRFSTSLDKAEKFSTSWFVSYLTFCSDLYKKRENDVCWEVLIEYFAEVEANFKKIKITKEIMVINSDILYFACKIWSPEEDDSFNTMLSVTRSLMGEHGSIFVQIMKGETYAHHCESVNPLTLFTNAYNTILSKESGSKKSEELTTLKTRVLVNMQLFTQVISPLNTQKRELEEESYFLDDADQLRWDSENPNSEVWDPDARIAKITALYKDIPVSLFKARVAYTLGLDAKADGNATLAEQLFFEAIFILASTELSAPSTVPLVSTLGHNCIKEYAEILLFNLKYKYAILCYEACCNNLVLRNRKEGYNQLLRTMAETAKENDDLKRAVSAYQELLENCIQNKKIPEIIYISKTLSKIYSDMGKFHTAEEYILGAYTLLPVYNISQNDPRAFELRLKLAQLYLRSYHPDRGLLLCSQLADNVTPSHKIEFLITRANGFIRKRQLRECTNLLKQITPVATDNFSSQNKTDTIYWELMAKAYYYSGNYLNAITAIDAAIHSCPSSTLAVLGKLFYMRGKIYQTIANNCKSIVFPTTLRPDGVIASKDARFYTCKGDLIQEAIAAYCKAYDYFKAIADDVRLAKALCRIAETYLDHLFTAVCLQNVPYSSISRFPLFTPSAIVRASMDGNEESDESGTESVSSDDFVITFNRIENPASLALEISAEISIPLLLLKCHLTMAELELLRGNKSLAIDFFEECYSALVNIFIVPVLGKYGPPQFLRKIFRLTKRALRFLFCMESSYINEHLFLIDAYNELESHIANSEAKPLPSVPEQENVIAATIALHNSRTTVKLPRESNRKVAKERRKTLARATRKMARQSTLKNVRSLFQNDDDVMVSFAQGTVDSTTQLSITPHVENIAEYVWSCLHCVKAQCNKYATENRCTQSEVFRKNQASLMKLSTLIVERAPCPNVWIEINPLNNKTVDNPMRDSKKRISIMGTAGSELPAVGIRSYEELILKYPRIARSMYTIQLDDNIIGYTPSTGGIFVQPLGLSDDFAANNDNASNNNNNNNNASNSNNSTSSSEGGQKFYYVQVILAANSSENASFYVKKAVTLQSFLDFLVELPNSGVTHEEPKSSMKKRHLFTSLRTTGSKALKLPIRLIESTKRFSNEMSDLVELSNLHKDEEHDPLSMCLSLAIKATHGNESYLLPLTETLNQSFQRSFPNVNSNPAKPLTVYIFATSMPFATQLNTTPTDMRKNLSNLTQETVNFISGLIRETSETSTSISQPASSLLLPAFKWLLDIVPATKGDVKPTKGHRHTGSTASDFPFTESISTYHPITNYPLMLVCSKQMQAIPWELILSNEYIIRYHTMVHAVNREHQLTENCFVSNRITMPIFYACHQPCFSRKIELAEEKRKIALQQSLQSTLTREFHITTQRKFSPKYLPFHNTPLFTGARLNKKKFRLISDIIDLSSIDVVNKIAQQPEKLKPHQCPVFIFSYADLTEMTEGLLYLLSWSWRCSFVFIPSSKERQFVQKFSKIQERYIKDVKEKGKDLVPNQYQFMMTIIRHIQTSLQVPITLVNVP